MTPAPPEIAPVEPPAPAAKSAARILILEDEQNMVIVLRRALAQAAMQPTILANGEQALRLLAGEPFDLVIVDITLPGISGLDVCRQIKADERLRHLPVIFISGQHANQTRAQAFALGAAEYLTKPFELPHLLACITRHLALAAARKSGLPPVAILPPL